MESPNDFMARRHAPDRRLSRRSLLGWSAIGTFGAAAGLLTAWTAYSDTRGQDADSGRVLFQDVFAGHSLNRNHWNPYMCDNNSKGLPWFMQPRIAVPSSAIGGANGRNAAYDLPSAVGVNDGLTLTVYRGTKAAGYVWTGSVICSLPTSNNFGSGTVHTTGFTFADVRVEVRAKMPDLTSGQWPAIWFLPAEGYGPEIDLFEGGFLAEGINPNHLMAAKLFTSGNQQQLVDVGTDLSADYHTYSMEYRQGSSVRFFFDDANVCTFTSNVPVGRYFMILSNGIASAQTAGWHTQASNSTPAVNLMRVSRVRVSAL